MVTEEKILEVARLYNLYKTEPGYIITISKTAKVSGRTIGKVQQMIRNGLITFDAEGEPQLAMPYEDIEKAVKKYGPSVVDSREKIAQKSAASTMEANVSQEATDAIHNYLVVGKAVTQAYYAYAARKGMDIRDIKNTPIHQAVITALNKEVDYNRMKNENIQLKTLVHIYEKETDPTFRVKYGCRMITQFLKALSLAQLAGFDVIGSGMIDYYQNLLNQYMTGNIEIGMSYV